MKRLTAQPNERVSLVDYLLGAGGQLSFEQFARKLRSLILPDGRSSIAAGAGARVFGGFHFDTYSLGVDAQLTLNRGWGILPWYEDGELTFGALQADEGPSSRALDFSGAANGIYAVYVKIAFEDAEYKNRVFWNPSGSPGQEFIGNVPTQKVQTWQATFQSTSVSPPGNGEWVKLYEVTVAGAVVTAVDDLRPLFFEGSAAAADGPFSAEWGDTSADRAPERNEPEVGISDLHRWVQFVNRQLGDIIGTERWAKVLEVSLAGLKPADIATNKAPLWRRVTYGQNMRGQETLRFTPRGRLVLPHALSDDFDYHSSAWGSATSCGPHYQAAVTGSSAITVAGSVATLSALGVGAYAALLTANLRTMRETGPSNRAELSFYAEIKPLAVTDVVILIAIVQTSSIRFWWELDTAVDANWHLRADDGAGGTFDLAVTPPSAGFTRLGIHLNPFANAGVGSVQGSIEIDGGNTVHTPETAMPGAGATFLDSMGIYAYIKTLDGSGALRAMDLDFWEYSDDVIRAGAPT